MKNRYILLFTLIFGLAGQTVQPADTFEAKKSSYWPTACKAVFSALPKDHTAAKMASAVYSPPARLTQHEQARKDTYSVTHHILSEYNIKPEYANWHLKTAENLMLAEGQKYDPDFGSRFKAWALDDFWALFLRNKKTTYFMPAYCMREIIENGPRLSSADKGSFHHERGHDYLEHLPAKIAYLKKITQKENAAAFYNAEDRETFLQIPNKEELLNDLVSYHHFCLEQEKQADAFVPDEPYLLAAKAKSYSIASRSSSQFDPEHPSDAQRAEYFRNRFKISIGLENEFNLDPLIEQYANDSSIIHDLLEQAEADSMQQKPLNFSDEYNAYLALKPLVSWRISFEKQSQTKMEKKTYEKQIYTIIYPYFWFGRTSCSGNEPCAKQSQSFNKQISNLFESGM